MKEFSEEEKEGILSHFDRCFNMKICEICENSDNEKDSVFCKICGSKL